MAFGYQLRSMRGKHRALMWQVVRSDGRVLLSTYDKTLAEDVSARFSKWACQGWPYIPRSAKNETNDGS